MDVYVYVYVYWNTISFSISRHKTNFVTLNVFKLAELRCCMQSSCRPVCILLCIVLCNTSLNTIMKCNTVFRTNYHFKRCESNDAAKQRC